MTNVKDSGSDSLPVIRLVPNIVTLAGLCFGLFALKSAIAGKWELAVIYVLISAVIDGMDGRLARLLNATSSFGAQLDSLADFFNFGIAPALILYMWMAHEIKGFGWAATLFFVICQVLRLARFNVSLEESDDKEECDKYFKGVPAPCGALLSLLPIMLTFLFKDNFAGAAAYITPLMVISYMSLISILMVSNIPTISIKTISIRRDLSYIALSFLGILFVALLIEPWFILPAIGMGYLCTIPFSVYFYYRSELKKQK